MVFLALFDTNKKGCIKVRKLVILVDMDGVLTDWTRRLAEVWRWTFSHEPPLLPEQQTSYNLHDWAPGKEDKLRHICQDQGFYLGLQWIKGAQDAIREMVSDTQLHVCICSSPHIENRFSCDEKMAWVGLNLGPEFQKLLILAPDKTIVRGDILIDDKPEVEGSFTPPWEHVIFDAPYNRHVTNRRRMSDWSQWREIVYG